jgi:hypothetical protein
MLNATNTDKTIEAITRYFAGMAAQENNARTFGFELGRKYARLFWLTGCDSRSVLSFVELATGTVYRADSWKKVGRAVGNIEEFALRAASGRVYSTFSASKVA